MERKMLIVCCVVGVLGLLSAALGFAAEAKRVKASDVKHLSSDVCIYPRSSALGLGFTAALTLMIAHIIINVATGCVCCRRGPHQSSSNWTLALSCFIASWFTFVIAFLLLLSGAALSEQRGEESAYFGGSYSCYVIKQGVFAGAALLSLASVFAGIMYYITLNSAKNINVVLGAPRHDGIPMGQPQFPPQNAQNPVFVHEDTYIRRQFA